MNRRHLGVIAGVAVLVVVAWFALLWSPKGADLADAKERRSAAQSQVDQLQARLDRLVAAKRDSARLQATAQQVGAAVPATSDLAGLLLALQGAASQAGVDYSAVNPTPVAAAPAGGRSEIALTMTISGRYGQVLGFLDRVLDLPRIVVVDSVNVSADQGAPTSPKLQVSIAARAFTTEAPAAPPGAAAPTAAAPTTTTVPSTSTNEMVP